MRRTGAFLLALLLGLAAARARAQTPIAVLGIEPQDAAEGLARELTQALRQRAAGASSFSPVAGKDLVEIKLVFGCVDEAPACMAHAGRSLGAAKLLFGSLRKAPGGLKVSLKWLDVPSARLEKALTELVAADLATTSGMRTLAVRWFATLSGVSASGSLVVNAPPGTRVFVDDQLAGTAGDHPLTVGQILPGVHEIRAEKWGVRSARARVRGRAGEVTQINAHLEAEVKEREKEREVESPSSTALIPPQSPEPMRDNGERPGHGMRIAFWSSVGAAALMTVSAIVAGTQVLSLEDDKAAAL